MIFIVYISIIFSGAQCNFFFVCEEFAVTVENAFNNLQEQWAQKARALAGKSGEEPSPWGKSESGGSSWQATWIFNLPPEEIFSSKMVRSKW